MSPVYYSNEFSFFYIADFEIGGKKFDLEVDLGEFDEYELKVGYDGKNRWVMKTPIIFSGNNGNGMRSEALALAKKFAERMIEEFSVR